MRIRDWSSDVGSSDRPNPGAAELRRGAGRRSLAARPAPAAGERRERGRRGAEAAVWRRLAAARRADLRRRRARPLLQHAFLQGLSASADRKSVVLGKRVEVRVDLGGRRIIKKKNKTRK